MKKPLFGIIAVATALIMVSWGVVGHRTIVIIATCHLTPEAQAGIKGLLGHTQLADVSIWANEVVNNSGLKQAAPGTM